MSSNSDSDRLPWQRKFFVPAVAALFVIYSLEMFLSARLESQTFDEPAHLYAGYSYWLRSDFGINPEHPPLVKLVASLPLLVEKPKYPEPTNVFFRADSAIGGRQLLGAPGSDSLLNRARVAVAIFALLLAVLVTLAGWEMFGQGAALFALTLFVFDPLLVAHGPLLGTDVGAACCIFATIYSFYRYVKRPTLVRLCLCAVAAGLSLAAKHSAILIFPVLILLSAVEVTIYRMPAAAEKANPLPVRGRARCALRMAASLLIIAVVSIAILWAFYGFRYQARPGGAQMTPPTAVFLEELHHPVEAKTIAFAERHHLLPEAYLYGFTDVTMLSRDGRVMYLFGKMYPQGRWFYFPAAFAIKSTIAFLLLLLLIPFSRILRRSELRREVLFLAIPPVVFFAAAMTSKLDIGIRHVMPAMPFLIVLAAAAAVSLASQSRVSVWAVSILLAIHVASSLNAFPNYLPYSNEFFGGPGRTYRVLSDSNAGWGGGLKALHVDLAKRHITECWLAYSALPDPANFGIPCKRLPTFFSMILDTGQQQAVPEQIQGPVFVSSEETAGSFWGTSEMNPYGGFVKLQPDHVIGGEILEFDGPFDVNRIAAVSHYMAVSRLMRSGKIDDAVAQARTAVALDPGSLRARELLASAYAAHHQPSEATQEFHTATHLFEAVSPEFVSIVAKPVDPLAPNQR